MSGTRAPLRPSRVATVQRPLVLGVVSAAIEVMVIDVLSVSPFQDESKALWAVLLYGSDDKRSLHMSTLSFNMLPLYKKNILSYRPLLAQFSFD